jgi:16S rRNA U516 pseudouridylate synthase RsuA-like enzyme
MVRTQIQLSEEQAKAVKRIAAAQGMSMAEVIRRAVNGVIISSPAGDWNERHKRALEIVGEFQSGKRDVSKNHDRYLAGAYRG